MAGLLGDNVSEKYGAHAVKAVVEAIQFLTSADGDKVNVRGLGTFRRVKNKMPDTLYNFGNKPAAKPAKSYSALRFKYSKTLKRVK